MLRGLFLCLSLICATAVQSDPLRIALLNTELDRKGPGLLLRDIVAGDDVQISAVLDLIATADADAILLLRFDWDADGAALAALTDRLADIGQPYPHRLSLRPNTGWPTTFDLDGDGRLRGPRDAQGYGLFPGHNGMALLSRLPIDKDSIEDFSGFLWRDMPGAVLPLHNSGAPFPNAQAQAAQRLSSVGHWMVPLVMDDGTSLHLLAFHASPPVFDGPEDANGLRNADELLFWLRLLDGMLATPPPPGPVVVIGGGNVDPDRGEGKQAAIRALLGSPHLQDPAPKGDAPVEAATVDWRGIAEPPFLRVDYILPDRELEVLDTGLLWPDAPVRGDQLRHALVWIDLAPP